MRLFTFVIALGCSQSSTGFSDKINDTAPEATGTIRVEPLQISWADLEPSLSDAKEFVVSNIGDADLRIERIDITNSGGGVYNLDEDANRNLALAAGESHTAIAVATFSEAGSAIGEFRIRSNDADAPDIRIPLCAYTVDMGSEVEDCALTSEDDAEGDSGE